MAQVAVPQLFIHGIHATNLRTRQPALHQGIQSMRVAAQKAGFEVIPRLVLRPAMEHIQELANAKHYDGRIDYSPTGEQDFDAFIHVLNLQELCNLEKHRRVWQAIVQGEEKGAFPDGVAVRAGAHHLVLEDDFTLHPDWETEYAAALRSAKDLVPLCAGPTLGRIWMSKESYLITPTAAKELLMQTEKVKWNTRGHLSWWAVRNSARVGVPAARITIDGSKVGLFPSSVHAQNPLVYNKDFVDLMGMLAAANEKGDIKAVLTMDELARYEQLALNLKSPDFLALVGAVHHRFGNYARARDLFIIGLQEMPQQGGVLGTNSELLVNAISIFKYLQDDLAEATKLPSKWTKMTAKPILPARA